MSRRDYAYIVSLAVGGILAAGLAFYFIIGFRYFEIPACIIYETTGLYCPACGGTRAMKALLCGEILRSFRYHPIVLYSIGVWGLFVGTETVRRIRKSGRGLPDRFWKYSVRFGLFLLIFHPLLRNILKFGFQIFL